MTKYISHGTIFQRLFLQPFLRSNLHFMIHSLILHAIYIDGYKQEGTFII